jgi:hypothetical protein
MKQHKWHKEIKAWADGAEIEFRYKDRYLGDEWELVEVLNDFGEEFEYRIKPQPKEPQYLYVYLDDNYEFSPIPLTGEWEYIGKIKLEDSE